MQDNTTLIQEEMLLLGSLYDTNELKWRKLPDFPGDAEAEKRRVSCAPDRGQHGKDWLLDTFAHANMFSSVKPQRVLFLCTGNSCRSHMAEGLLRKLGGDRFEVFSAGSKPAGYVHPLAIKAMAEVGADISHHASKSLQEFVSQPFDYVITVCDNAREACPVFPAAAKQLHWSFDDPAHAQGADEEKMTMFRRVRDEIRERLESFLKDVHG